MPTIPTQMRLTADTLDQLKKLAADLGGLSRTDVVRLAVRELYERRAPSQKKSSKKTSQSP